MNRLELIKQRVKAHRETLENPPEIMNPSQEDLLEEIEVGRLQAEKEQRLEDYFLAEAFEGFGQG